jgi:hypothetical protein
MKRTVVVSALTLTAAAAALIWTVSAGQADEGDKLRDFMRAKLSHSQKIIEGLTTEDYDMIAKNSQDLSLLSQAATWQVFETPEYLQHSTEFHRAADALTKAATDKNLDGAALAYMEVTLKCVNCHKYVRRVRMADLRGPEGGALLSSLEVDPAR